MIKKKLSIIIPVYNEEKTIITTLKKIKVTKDEVPEAGCFVVAG